MKRTLAVSDSFLAFAVVFVAGFAFMAAIAVVFIPFLIRLLQAFT